MEVLRYITCLQEDGLRLMHCFGKGLSTQMESLQRLGVTRPGHITDLLVTDLEEAGTCTAGTSFWMTLP